MGNNQGLLKLIFLLHLVLSSWGMQSAFTVPTAYLFTNLIFMVVLLWAIVNPSSTDSIGMAFVINAVIFVIDIITLSVYWPRGDRHRLYLGFAITNTILRPVTCLLLHRVFRELDVNGQGIVASFFGDTLSSLNLLERGRGQDREYRGTSGRVGSENVPRAGAQRSSYEQISTEPQGPIRL